MTSTALTYRDINTILDEADEDNVPMMDWFCNFRKNISEVETSLARAIEQNFQEFKQHIL
ncbi:hypothetical protein SK128_024730 [Halocaridina rubra]|uniref:Uncharacterized protein n=1 Tax=Halocaridina rubra TaxID=373956 RepID=A0AAN8ZVX4_HALRR